MSVAGRMNASRQNPWAHRLGPAFYNGIGESQRKKLGLCPLDSGRKTPAQKLAQTEPSWHRSPLHSAGDRWGGRESRAVLELMREQLPGLSHRRDGRLASKCTQR